MKKVFLSLLIVSLLAISLLINSRRPQLSFAVAYCGNGMCEAGEDPTSCPSDCAGDKVYCGSGPCEGSSIFCTSACGGGNTCWTEPECTPECFTASDCPNAVDLGSYGGCLYGCNYWDQCGCSKSCNRNCINNKCIYSGGACGPGPQPSPVVSPSPLPASCTVSLSPSSVTVENGGSVLVTANITVSGGGTVNYASFSSSNTGIATVSPATDYSSPTYTTYVQGVAAGSATVGVTVFLNSSPLTCTAVPIPVSVSAGPWLQTGGGDVHGNGEVGTYLQ